MSIETHVFITPSTEAQLLADTDGVPSYRVGFSYTGFDRVQVCTLLSLLTVGNPETEFEKYLDTVDVVQSTKDDWPVVSVFETSAVALLARTTKLDDTDLEALAEAWGRTEEFDGWSFDDILDLLQELGDLADSALLQNQCIVIWQAP